MPGCIGGETLLCAWTGKSLEGLASWRLEMINHFSESYINSRVIADFSSQITYLNSVVMPDEPESESGEDDAEESSSGSEDGESEG